MTSYPHMCRMDHEEIGHRDSEDERCPLCRRIDALDVVTRERDTARAEATRLRAALEHISKQAREVCLKPEFKNVLGQPLCFSCEDVLPNHSEPNSDCLGWAGNVAERALAAVPNDPRPEWDTAERICAKLYAEAARLRAALEQIRAKHIAYDEHSNNSYQIGVVDGHRCASRWAQDALAASPSDTLDALRELIAAAKQAAEPCGSAGDDIDRLNAILTDPRLAWLRP